MNEIQIQFVANLTADPELRFTPSGQAVASVRLAQTPRVKQNDQWVDGETTFLNGSVWGDYAENVVESLQRGDRVLVIGTLRSRSYTDRTTGEIRTVPDLRIEEIAPSLRFATVRVTKVSRTGAARAAGTPATADPSGESEAYQTAVRNLRDKLGAQSAGDQPPF